MSAAVQGPGRGLDPPTRAFMESRLGHDFSSVRIHDGPAADRSARAVAADAYTVGGDVVFAAGRYRPGTDAGRRTLAHELTHVVQQRTGPVTGRPLGGDLMVSDPTDRFEREAESVAERVSEGQPTAQRLSGAEVQVQRLAPLAVAGLVGGIGLVAGGAYLAWATSCLSPLQQPLWTESFTRFLPRYHRDTGRPVHSRVWDAFGHCWIGCAGTKKCGSAATAAVGKGREFYREYIGGGPHDSYAQDTNNQTIGREYGRQDLDCFTACDAAARGGTLDLSAPEGTCFNGAGEYSAPCEPGGPVPGAPAPGVAAPAGVPGP